MRTPAPSMCHRPPRDFSDGGGYVLVTSLFFLVVLTLVAVTAMQNTGLEQRMSANVAFELQSRESSESGRGSIAEVMDNHIFYRGWPSPLGSLTAGTFTVPDGLDVCVKADSEEYECAAAGNRDSLYDEKPVDYATAVTDYRYPDAVFSPNMDATDDSADTATSQLYVYRLGTIIAPGSGAAQDAGYEGTGKTLAGSGVWILFDMRSRSVNSSGKASALTGNYFRAVIRN